MQMNHVIQSLPETTHCPDSQGIHERPGLVGFILCALVVCTFRH